MNIQIREVAEVKQVEEGRTFFIVLNVLMGLAVAMTGVSMAVLVVAALSR